MAISGRGQEGTRKMSYEIQFSPNALEDLQGIEKCIKEDLSNLKASDRIIGMLFSEIERLSCNPGIGVKLSSRFGIEADYRYLVAEDYVIIYIRKESIVRIIDVFNGHQDYIRKFLNK